MYLGTKNLLFKNYYFTLGVGRRKQKSAFASCNAQQSKRCQSVAKMLGLYMTTVLLTQLDLRKTFLFYSICAKSAKTRCNLIGQNFSIEHWIQWIKYTLYKKMLTHCSKQKKYQMVKLWVPTYYLLKRSSRIFVWLYYTKNYNLYFT